MRFLFILLFSIFPILATAEQDKVSFFKLEVDSAESMKTLGDINLEISRGEIHVLIGPNGAGKSTLLTIAGDYQQPTGSDLEVTLINQNDGSIGTFTMPGGLDLSFMPTGRIRPGLGGIALEIGGSEAGIWYVGTDTSVVGPLAFALGTLNKAGTRMGSNRPAPFGDGFFSNKLTITQLSGGQTQRVEIARTLSLAPKVIVADEPVGSVKTGTAPKVENKPSTQAEVSTDAAAEGGTVGGTLAAQPLTPKDN